MTLTVLAPIGRRDLVALAILSLIRGRPPVAGGGGGCDRHPGQRWLGVHEGRRDPVLHGQPGHARPHGGVDRAGRDRPAVPVAVGGDPWAFTADGLVFTLVGVVAMYLLAAALSGPALRSWWGCWWRRSLGLPARPWR